MTTDAAGAVVMIRALQAGRAAAEAGQPITVCPHDPDAERAHDRALARMWIRGYSKASTAEVDYSG
ncbi:Rmf/CrpP fold protein [Actinomadura rubrisoli]|uniref:Uncharacterized protein n=1 Tax=Actinomadura rubrisoli TaxID=2530368 RepID=A0A4R5BYH6_9ACTN|nr:Rmf/CrpP fold protein [Actinomadura rubrisoli]TDD90783.1 hypothetical protein E1298_12850 [Actinomadura rubrisoli]